MLKLGGLKLAAAFPLRAMSSTVASARWSIDNTVVADPRVAEGSEGEDMWVRNEERLGKRGGVQEFKSFIAPVPNPQPTKGPIDGIHPDQATSTRPSGAEIESSSSRDLLIRQAPVRRFEVM